MSDEAKTNENGISGNTDSDIKEINEVKQLNLQDQEKNDETTKNEDSKNEETKNEESNPKGGTVYINNLPREEELKEEDIKELFSEYGEIDKVKIVLEHDSKRPKGYAFIE